MMKLALRFVQSSVTAASAILFASMGAAQAATVNFSGSLNDSANAALIGSVGYDPSGSPLFASDWDVANNVAVYSLAVSVAGTVEFKSGAYAAGGIDPYFTLFQGTGGGTTVLGSNYAQAFSTGGDFDLLFNLAAGNYTVALGVFANMSYAENYGSGTLADGFTGLGSPGSLGDYAYDLTVMMPDSNGGGGNGGGGSVPEPSTSLLALLALLALGRATVSRRANARIPVCHETCAGHP